MSAYGALWAGVPHRPSLPLCAQGAAGGGGSPGLVVPQKPSAPSLTQVVALSSTRSPFVAVTVAGPRSGSAGVAWPLASVVACRPSPRTVAPAEGTIVVVPVLMSVWDSVTV